MIFYTNLDTETEAVGKALAVALERDGRDRAFIAMRGEMGVGKTAFTRGFASHFGISGVKSPTYTIVNEHVGRAKLYHFDMYRITDGDDLYSIGYDDYVESDGYCIAADYADAEPGKPLTYTALGFSDSGKLDDYSSLHAFAEGLGLEKTVYDNGGIPVIKDQALRYFYHLGDLEQIILTGKDLYHGKALD